MHWSGFPEKHNNSYYTLINPYDIKVVPKPVPSVFQSRRSTQRSAVARNDTAAGISNNPKSYPLNGEEGYIGILCNAAVPAAPHFKFSLIRSGFNQ